MRRRRKRNRINVEGIVINVVCGLIGIIIGILIVRALMPDHEVFQKLMH